MIDVHPATNELADAIRTCPNGSTLLVHPGTYDVTPNEPVDVAEQFCAGAALPMAGKHSITIQGTGDPVIRSLGHGSILGLQDCSHIQVRGLTFEGAGYLTEQKLYYFASLYLGGNNHHLRIGDCLFRSGGNHGIGHLLEGVTRDSVFRDLSFENGGSLNHPMGLGDGAAIACGGVNNTYDNISVTRWLRGLEWETKYDHPTSGNIARGCRMFGCQWEAVYINPSHTKADLFFDNHLVDCIIKGTGKPFDAKWRFEHGIRINGGRNWSIRGGSISNLCDESGIATELCSDLTDGIIEGVRIYDCDRSGIHLEQPGYADFKIARIMVRGNQIGPVGGRGIFLDGSELRCVHNQVRETGPAGKRWEGVYIKEGPSKASITTSDNWLRDTKETEASPD